MNFGWLINKALGNDYHIRISEFESIMAVFVLISRRI